jgi:hypothetical protein
MPPEDVGGLDLPLEALMERLDIPDGWELRPGGGPGLAVRPPWPDLLFMLLRICVSEAIVF